MAKQPRSEMGEQSFPLLGESQSSRRLVAKHESLAIPSLVMIGLVALVGAITIRSPRPFNLRQLIGLQPLETQEMSEPFRLAVNKAQLAGELTQVAYYREEWQKVELLWTEAVALMKEVSETSAQYSVARQKVNEYGRNRDYAYSNVVKKPAGAPIKNQLWTKGATREFLLAVQGLPTHQTQYDSFCREIYHYDKSEVELHHGLVTNYLNHDNNLNASPLLDESTNRSERGAYWALGSTKQAVIAAQGTPTRVQQYESLGTEIFYYDTSIIELRNGVVVGYSDFDDILKVNINMMVPQGGYTVVPSIAEVRPSANTWSIGASRADVFRVQGTPNQVTRNHTDCLETLHYEHSTVELKNGIVQEYDNLSNNLNVRLTNSSFIQN